MENHELSTKTEESAVSWPQKEYRIWVQSQVETGVFRRLLGIFGGVTAISLFSALVGFAKFSNDISIQISAQGDRIRTSLIADMNTKFDDFNRYFIDYTLPSSMATARFDLLGTINESLPAKISEEFQKAESVRTSVAKSFSAQVNSFAATPEFTEILDKKVRESLDDRGSLETLIGSFALDRAKNAETPPATRAMALQLYLLYSGEAAQEDVQRNIASVVYNTSIGELSGSLSQTVFSHYPFVESETFMNRAIAKKMLRALLLDSVLPESDEYLRFFLRAPEYTTIDIIPILMKNPDSPVSLGILRQVVQKGSPSLLSATLPSLTRATLGEEDDGARRLGLTALALLDPYAEIDVAVRQTALDEIVTSRLFSNIEINENESIKNIEIDTGEIISDDDTLLSMAVLKLLRTNDSTSENAWENMEEMAEGDFLRKITLLWVRRAEMDAIERRNPAVDPVVELMAEMIRQGRQVELEGIKAAIPLSIELASDVTVEETSRDALIYLRTGQAKLDAGAVAMSDVAYRIIYEAIKRDLKKDGSELYTVRSLLDQSAESNESLRNFTLAVIGGDDVESARRQDSSAIGAALVSSLAGNSDVGDDRIGAVVLGEFRRIMKSAGRCAALRGVEERFGGNTADYGPLREALPWLATDLPPGSQRFDVSGGWQVEGVEASPEGGGTWLRLDVKEPVELTATSEGSNVEVVVMDAGRKRRTDEMRSTAKGAVRQYLQRGVYAVSLRECGGQGALPKVSLGARAISAIPLHPNEPDSPAVALGWSTFDFEAGEEGGEAWVRVPVEAGQYFYAETRSSAMTSDEPPDTILSVEGTSLRDDDSGNDTYSRLAYEVSDGTDEVLLKMESYSGTFVSGDAVALDVGVFSPSEIVHAGDNPTQTATIELGVPQLVEYAGDKFSYLKIDDPDDALVVIPVQVRKVTTPEGDLLTPVGATVAGEPAFLLKKGMQYVAQLDRSEGAPLVVIQTTVLAAGASISTDAEDLEALGVGPPAPMGGFLVGDWVRLGRHEEVDGSMNWAEEMEKYVGCVGQILGDAGKEPGGLNNVYVDINYEQGESEWVWRTVNLERARPGDAQPERCPQR